MKPPEPRPISVEILYRGGRLLKVFVGTEMADAEFRGVANRFGRLEGPYDNRKTPPFEYALRVADVYDIDNVRDYLLAVVSRETPIEVPAWSGPEGF